MADNSVRNVPETAYTQVLCGHSGRWEPGKHLCPEDLLLEESGRIGKYALESYPRFPNPSLVANILEVLLPTNRVIEAPSLSPYMIRSKIRYHFGPNDPATIRLYLDSMEANGLLVSNSDSYRSNLNSVATRTRHYKVTAKGTALYRELKSALDKFDHQSA